MSNVVEREQAMQAAIREGLTMHTDDMRADYIARLARQYHDGLFHPRELFVIVSALVRAWEKPEVTSKLTMKDAGYSFVGWHKVSGAIFRDEGTGRLEHWGASKDAHASFGFHHRGHYWEFTSSAVTEKDIRS